MAIQMGLNLGLSGFLSVTSMTLSRINNSHCIDFSPPQELALSSMVREVVVSQVNSKC